MSILDKLMIMTQGDLIRRKDYGIRGGSRVKKWKN